jgi:hypothetical protein
MISCPTAAELRSALDAFDREDGPPDGRRLFLARVADNARALLTREAAFGETAETEERARLAALLGADGDYRDLNGRLCEALRSGAGGPPGQTGLLLI